MHATRRKNLGDTLYIIHIPDVYHQFLVVKGKDIYLKQKNDIEISKNISGALWEERKDSLQLHLWNLNSTSNSPVAPHRLSCQTSANQRKAETSTNVNNHYFLKKHMLWVMTSLLVSSLPINISHQLFQSRYLNSRDIVASSSSFSCPAARAPRRACTQAG